jgi:DNA polymerase
METISQLKVELGQVIASLEDYLRSRKEEGCEGLPFADLPAPEGRDRLLHNIRQKLGECTRCKLHRSRTHIVFGTGNPEARLVFVGEGPGEDEDRQGEPFVGRAGQLLTRIIQSINLTREEVYIANIIKCRPPGNRNPEPDEIKACEPFLIKQLEAIQPKIICALGTFAAQTLLQTDEKISRLRGRFFSYRNARLMATFHPAFLLRNQERKRDVWEDMKMIREEYCR